MVRAVGGAKIHSNWSASAGQLIFTRDNASVGITWGEDGSGIDSTWFGETAGAKMQWVVSSDTLVVTSADVTFTANAFNFASASMSGNLVHAGSTTITFGAATNIVLSSASGSMIGTTSTQKIGFLGAAPIIAEKFSISATDIASAMRNFGLMTTLSA